MMLSLLMIESLHKEFRILLHGNLCSPICFTIYLFMSVNTYGYLFYSLGYIQYFFLFVVVVAISLKSMC